MSDATAPDAALRDQMAKYAAEWAFMYPISSWALREGKAAERLAEIWGKQIAEFLAPVVAAALTAARCPSCDHRTDMHQPDGCWFTVTHGMAGRELVCPCVVTLAALDRPADPPAKETR